MPRFAVHAFAAALCCCAGLTAAWPQPTRAAESSAAAMAPASADERIQAHVEFLAGPECSGRRMGTPGCVAAADYIKRVLGAQVEVRTQDFEITQGIRVSVSPSLSLGGQALASGSDYSVAPISDSGALTDAPLLFGGYGIHAPDLGWDDYAGLETAGAVALIIRGEPLSGEVATRIFAGDQPSVYADLRRKASAARDLGIKALLVLENPLDSKLGPGELPEQRPTYSATNFDIPVLFITAQAAAPLLPKGPYSLADILKYNDEGGRSSARAVEGTSCSLDIQVERDRVPAWNIYGLLPGSDAGAGTIVIGAHYDHLGLGGPESLAPEQYGTPHWGADDNASGVAAVLELAARYGSAAQRPRHSLLFVFFSAEEIGTVGSDVFVKNLPVPHEQVLCMLNFDMVGRMRDDKLIVEGTGTAAEFPEVLRGLDGQLGLQVEMGASGFGASDHMSFVKAKMPALFFFTGTHEDYHTPRDTADKVNPAGIASTADYAVEVLTRLDKLSGPLSFQEVAAPQQGKSRSELQVTLGTIPSYTESAVEGMAVGDVRPGGPAAVAGIKGGDIIIEIAGKKIGSIHDFIFALTGRNPGEVVEVKVLRGTETLSFQVTLAAKNVEQ
ncbi:M20/M25/M40 family metallo-hydrolase [bacterium]|nr:M20/M25/M40 family metallo-hydrolase [bacterium]